MAARPSRPMLRHVWNECVGAGRANEALRADWQAHFREAVDVLGARYVRFHGLFHDDMFVYRASDGGGFGPHSAAAPSRCYTFAYVDKVFDAVLDAGARPFVELGFMPRELATQTETAVLVEGALQPAARTWTAGSNWSPRRCGTGSSGTASTRSAVAVRGVERAQPRAALLDRHADAVLRAVRGHARSAIKAIDPGLKVGRSVHERLRPGRPVRGRVRRTGRPRSPRRRPPTPTRSTGSPCGSTSSSTGAPSASVPLDFLSTHLYPTDYAVRRRRAGHADPAGTSDATRTTTCVAHARDHRRTARTPTPSCTSPSGRARRRAATRSTTPCSPPRTSRGRSSGARPWRTRSRTGPSPTCSRRAAPASARSTAVSAW